MGKSIYKWAIFNSYVSLPEGIYIYMCKYINIYIYIYMYIYSIYISTIYIYMYRRFLWGQAWPWSMPHATAEFPAGRMWIVSLGEVDKF